MVTQVFLSVLWLLSQRQFYERAYPGEYSLTVDQDGNLYLAGIRAAPGADVLVHVVHAERWLNPF